MGKEDEWSWKYEVIQTFTIKPTYNVLEKEENAENSNILRQFWNIKALSSSQVVGDDSFFFFFFFKNFII